MKYKLKIKYPGLPVNWTVGMVVKFGHSSGNKPYYFPEDESIFTCLGLTKDSVENSPEFWEKVVEKTYEVLQYRCNALNENIIATLKEDGLYHFDGSSMIYSPAKTITNINYKIHSVKRLSDGEIFTIGDKIKDCNSQNTITEFEIKDENGYRWKSIGVKYESGGIDLTFVEKTKQPLFTTEDGVDIFEGNDIWWVAVNLDTELGAFDKLFSYKKFNWKTGNPSQSKNYKWFSTKEKAQEYIIMNKPCLSINVVMDMLKNKSFVRIDSRGEFLHQITEYTTNSINATK